MAFVEEDDSVVMAGSTEVDDGSGANAGNLEFSAVKINSDGQEIWRWQASVLLTARIHGVSVCEV